MKVMVRMMVLVFLEPSSDAHHHHQHHAKHENDGEDDGVDVP